MKISIETADSVSSVASFFRLSEDDVLSRSKNLVRDLAGSKVIIQSDYSILRRFLFPLQPSLKPLNSYVLRRNLMAVHDNEKLVIDFLSNCKSIVSEPITSNKYVWTEDIKQEFYGYLKLRLEKDTYTVSNIALRYGVKPSLVYSVAYHFSLIENADLEHLSTEAYYTLCLFFERFEFVKDSSLVERVRAVSHKSVVKIRMVGSFVEKSVIDYVESAKRGLVTTFDGEDFVSLSNLVSYMESNGARVSRTATKFMDVAKTYGSKHLHNIEGGSYFSKSFLDRVLELKNSSVGISAGEALVIESGNYSLEDFNKYLNHYKLVSVLMLLEESGVISKNLKRHLSTSISSESGLTGLRLVEPSSVERVLTQHVYGLPVDKVYVNHISVNNLIEYLNHTDKSYAVPEFLNKTLDGYELAPNSLNYVNFISFSISIVHIGAISADLYRDYMEWADNKFSDKVNLIKSAISNVMGGDYE